MKAYGPTAAADFIATSPEGIHSLRSYVCEMAVRGRLSTRGAADEPASLFISKLPRRPGSGEPPAEAPFDVPKGWVPVRLRDLGVFVGGKTPSMANPAYWTGGIPWVTAKDMKRDQINTSELEVSPVATENGLTVIPPGAVLVVVRSGILRRTVPVATNVVPVTINQDLKALRLHPGVSADYVRLMIRGFEAFILERLTKRGTTVESLKFDEFSNQAFILPPEAEQVRILGLVRVLMESVRRLEVAEEAHEVLRLDTRDAVLERLEAAVSRKDARVRWEPIAIQLAELVKGKDDIDRFGQTLRQLAIRGLLASPGGEPAHADALIENAAAERGHLIRQGRIRSSGPRMDRATVDPPFALPPSWRWVRCDDLFITVTDGDHAPPPRAVVGVPFLVIGNLSRGFIDLSSTRKVPVEYYDRLDWAHRPRSGDLLYTVTGSVGITIVVGDQGPFCVQRHIAILKPPAGASPSYLQIVLSSRYALDYAREHATGTAQKTLSLAALRALPIPLPPKQTQDRIAESYDGFAATMDRLKAALTTSRQTHRTFAVALLRAGITTFA